MVVRGRRKQKLTSSGLADALRVMGQRPGPSFDRLVLFEYSRTLDSNVRRYALPNTGRLDALRRARLGASVDLVEYMGEQDGIHSLRTPGIPWLRLFETQVCRGLSDFLGPDRTEGGVRLLLEALVPDFAWPETLDDGAIDLEVKCHSAGRRQKSLSRIDMVISGKSRGTRFGAIVEVKTGKQKVINPLPAYTSHVKEKYGLWPTNCERGEANAAFVVLVPHASPKLRQRLSHFRNKHWRIVEWPVLLRRLEARIRHDSQNFRHFRKAIWDTVDA